MADEPLGGEDPRDEDDPASIAERAAAGENEEETQGEAPIRGDHQLSLNLGNVSKAKKVEEATISLSSAQRPIDGLLEVDTEYDLVVRVRPQRYETRPIRKDGKTRAWTQRQPCEVLSVRRADAEELVRDMFAEVLDRSESEAASLLDELADFLKHPVEEAA